MLTEKSHDHPQAVSGSSSWALYSFLKNIPLLDSLKIPPYRWFLLSALASYTGMQMMTISQGYLIYDSTGSAMSLGLVMVGFSLPLGIISPVAGVLADRMNKVFLISLSMGINIVMAIFMGFLALYLDVKLWHLLVIGLLMGTGFAFNIPARMSLIRQLVGKDILLNAVSLSTGVMNFTRIIGPAVAGYIIVSWSISGVFFVIAAFYFVAMLLLFPLAHLANAEVSAAKRESVLFDIRAGLSYLRENPILIILLSYGFVVMSLAINYINLMPAFAKESLGLDAGGLGLLLSSAGAGALAGSLSVSSLRNFTHKGWLLVSSGMLWGLAILAFSSSSAFSLSIALLLFLGFCHAAFFATQMTLIQSNTSKGMQGRVTSIFALSFGLMPIGVLPVSVIAEYYGIAYGLGLAAVIIVSAGLAITLFTSRVRKLA